jgi:hypothetical protein
MTGIYVIKPALTAELSMSKDAGAKSAFGKPPQVASNTATSVKLTIPTRLLSIRKHKDSAKAQMPAGSFGDLSDFILILPVRFLKQTQLS